MKYFSWLLKAAVFFIVFAFALNNQGDVRVHFFFGNHWDAPLVLVVLATLVIGVAVGIAVMLPLWLKARRARPSAVLQTAERIPGNDSPPHGI